MLVYSLLLGVVSYYRVGSKHNKQASVQASSHVKCCLVVFVIQKAIRKGAVLTLFTVAMRTRPVFHNTPDVLWN